MIIIIIKLGQKWEKWGGVKWGIERELTEQGAKVGASSRANHMGGEPRTGCEEAWGSKGSGSHVWGNLSGSGEIKKNNKFLNK